MLAGLPTGSITPDHASIPEIPAVKADTGRSVIAGIESAQMFARSKQQMARAAGENMWLPQISFGAEYLRSTQILNDADHYYAHNIPTNNFRFRCLTWAIAPRPKKLRLTHCELLLKLNKPSGKTRFRSPCSPAVCANWTPWRRLPP
jgi:hypothetical protein